MTKRTRILSHCIKKDATWDSAKILVDNAIKTHMQLNGVDRNTACCWVFGALRLRSEGDINQ